MTEPSFREAPVSSSAKKTSTSSSPRRQRTDSKKDASTDSSGPFSYRRAGTAGRERSLFCASLSSKHGARLGIERRRSRGHSDLRLPPLAGGPAHGLAGQRLGRHVRRLRFP